LKRRHAVVISSLVVAAASLAPGAVDRVPPAPSRAAPPAAEGLSWVDSLVREEALDRAVPGIAVAIVSRGRIVLQRGYGLADVEAGRPVTAATPFNIASLTKPFTSTVAVRLARRGLLDLERPVRAYLPTLPARYAGISVRHLLTHTSGVDRDLRADNFDDPTAGEYRMRVDTAGIHAAPGERWEYSNTGYTILGWAIAAAADRPLGELFEAEIFGPLAMLQARYRAPLAADPERARPHEVVEGTVREAAYVTGGFASGGLSMSIADLASFGVALQGGDLLAPGEKDLAWTQAALADGSTVSFEMMNPGAGYGLGWFLTRFADRRLITHGGGISGYASNLYHFPDEALTIAVLANAKARDDGQAPVDPLARAIATACFDRDACSGDPRSAAIEEELDAANRAFSSAYVAGDADGLRAAYLPEALVMPPAGPVVAGADRAAAWFESGGRPGHLGHALYPEYRRIDGETAFELGTWYDAWVRSGDTIASSGRYVLGWRRDGGRWRMATDAWQRSERP